jgi:hypothetical protein
MVPFYVFRDQYLNLELSIPMEVSENIIHLKNYKVIKISQADCHGYLSCGNSQPENYFPEIRV